MAFIETLEKFRVYLENKTNPSKEEINLLAQVREDLNGFPISVLSREDLAEHGFDANLVDDTEMITVACKMGEDYWEQLSIIQIPIIADILKLPKAKCPLCSFESTFVDGKWICNNHKCRSSWSFMKYTLVEDIQLAGLFRIKNIGYPLTDNKFGPMLIPVDKYRTHTGNEPERQTLYHSIVITDVGKIEELLEEGFTLYTIYGDTHFPMVGNNVRWMSCYSNQEE